MFGYLHDMHIEDWIRTKWGGGDLPINQNKTNLKFHRNIMDKIKIEEGIFNENFVNSNI